MFRSYDHPDPGQHGNVERTGEHLNPAPAHDTPLWQAARATSAAPGYFEKIRIENVDYTDGGLGCNNPAKVAFTDIRQVHGMRPPKLVLSIGTGAKSPCGAAPMTKMQKFKQNVKRPWTHQLDLMKAFRSSIELATNSERTHRELAALIDDIRRNPLTATLHYFRFNVPGIVDMDLDEWLPRSNGSETKARLRSATEDYLQDARVWKELVECAIRLVEYRRERSATERWEQFATDTLYNCPSKCNLRRMPPECPLSGLCLKSRAELRRHAFEMHGFVSQVLLDQESYRELQRSRRPEKPGSSLPDEHYLCIWDECGQVNPIVFETEDDFFSHLKHEHGISSPQIKRREVFETWLDKGRTTGQIARREANRSARQRGEQMQDSRLNGIV